MTFLLLFFLPALLVNLTASAVSRKRPSLPFFLLRAMAGIAASVALCAFVLLPAQRMQYYSTDGMLRLTFGKSAVAALLGFQPILGLLFGLTLDEQADENPARRRSTLPYAVMLSLLFVLLFFSQAYIWGQQVYGNTTLDEIIYYINMPLEGTSVGFVESAIDSVLIPALMCFIPIAALSLLPARKRRSLRLLRRIRLPLFPLRLPLLLVYPVLFIWLAALIATGGAMLDLSSFINGYLHASTFIEENYVAPDSVQITFPENKRNLITIYLESYETTPQDIASGGALHVNLIPEMTELARENISFSRNELITGAATPPRCTWTIAGLICQTAGLPLLNIFNNAENGDGLLPGAVTLGDLLKEEGYRLTFLAGSDFTFGGRRSYYASHGDYEIWDLVSAREQEILPIDYYESWGFEDVKLYEYAKSALKQIAQDDQPFHFAMLTADTHAPGYRCPLCPTDYQNARSDSLTYADALRCSSRQLDEFLDWCRQQPFYENTSIVITGDHASMQEYFYNNFLGSEEAGNAIERYVYNAFVNSAVEPVKENGRLFTTMDFFPTTLASLGVSIEGERLGLGTNLFSDRETLSEQYGEDYLNQEMGKKSLFYERELLYQQNED
ncbi:MAG: LTA synthase family protein [Clostridia bacterium]|nr:LTA synthase family protein [Clostridia bacterium]